MIVTKDCDTGIYDFLADRGGIFLKRTAPDIILAVDSESSDIGFHGSVHLVAVITLATPGGVIGDLAALAL